MTAAVFAIVLDWIASQVLMGVSHVASRMTPAEMPLVVRMSLDDRRYARTWREPLRFTLSVVDTSAAPVVLPGNLRVGRDVRICLFREGGYFLRDLRMRSATASAEELEPAFTQIPAGGRIRKGFREAPLITVPLAGLFWTWAEVEPAEGQEQGGDVPEGTFRSNPLLIWWQAKPVRLATELRRIGAAIRRHQALVSPFRQRPREARSPRKAARPLTVIPIAPAEPAGGVGP